MELGDSLAGQPECGQDGCGQGNCRCIIDTSTPATLERDFHAWLQQGTSPSPSSSGTEYSLETPPDYNFDMFGTGEYLSEYDTCYIEYAMEYTPTLHLLDQPPKMEPDGEMRPAGSPQSESEPATMASSPTTPSASEGKPLDGRRVRRKGGTNLYGRPYCPGRPLSMLERTRIIELHLAGIKVNAISKTLCISHGCVSKIISRYRATGILSPASSPEQRRVRRKRNSVNGCEDMQPNEIHHHHIHPHPHFVLNA